MNLNDGIKSESFTWIKSNSLDNLLTAHGFAVMRRNE